MKKMQKGGSNPGKKKARLEKRANRVMSRAQKTYAESLGAIEDAKKSGTKADVGGAEQLQNRSLRQEARAKKIKAKASTMKTGGMVNTNTKASVLKKAGTNGVTACISAGKRHVAKVYVNKAADKRIIPIVRWNPNSEFSKTPEFLSELLFVAPELSFCSPLSDVFPTK
jgi:hypothetical protein